MTSAVAAQPMSDEETLRGAEHRARAALASDASFAYGVGVEGGIQPVGNRYMEGAFLVVMDRQVRLFYRAWLFLPRMNPRTN